MIAIALIMTGVLWITFVMLSGWIHRYRKGNLSPMMQGFTKVFGLLFVFYDVVYNVSIGSILFLEIPSPARLTLTERLKHIRRNPPHRAFFFDKLGTWIPTYRYMLATFFCERLINPNDENHC